MNIDILRGSIDKFIDQYACLSVAYNEAKLIISCVTNKNNFRTHIDSFEELFGFIENQKEDCEDFFLNRISFAVYIDELISAYGDKINKSFWVNIDCVRGDFDNHYKIEYSYLKEVKNIRLKNVFGDINLVRELDSIISKIQIEV